MSAQKGLFEIVRNAVRSIILQFRGKHYTSVQTITRYFNLIRPLTWLNHYRYLILKPGQPPYRLHIGNGPKYLPGWTNIEGLMVWKTDLVLDIRDGLPFPDASVEAVYCCHVLEHFNSGEQQAIIREIYRTLKPGGCVRLITPSLSKCVQRYIDKKPGVSGSRFGDFKSPGAIFNFEILCDNHHPVMMDFGFFQEVLERAGKWTRIVEGKAGASEVLSAESLQIAEGDRFAFIDDSLVVEAWKA